MSPRTLRLVLFLLTTLVAACANAADADDKGFRDMFAHLDLNRWYISNGWSNGDYQSCEWSANAVSAGGELHLRLSEPGGKLRNYACPEIRTGKKLGYGLYEARMRTASGAGLNTAFFTYIGPPNGVPEWDEIDFEFLGKDSHSVQLNYYANGKAQLGKLFPLGFDASQDFHNYAFDWAPDKIRWYVDGKLLYETPADAKLPHNPGFLFLSLWSGSQVEDAWLGHFNYTSPVTADIAWTAYTPAGAPCQFPDSLKCNRQK
jgi:endo-1,3-1,4-beta-glycanase ExoK